MNEKQKELWREQRVGEGGREGGETVLTLSKSIPVKSQVPIQVLLEEEGTEPERSPWEELPPSQTYIILISASPIIGLTRPP